MDINALHTFPMWQFLEQYADGWQLGESGVLAHLVQTKTAEWGELIEIGGGDGVGLPLSLGTSYNEDRRLIVYEADDEARASLEAVYPDATIRGMFTADSIAELPRNPAAIVIDVDGPDIIIMGAILEAGVRPAILMVEHYDLCGPRAADLLDVPPPWLLGMSVANAEGQTWCIQSPQIPIINLAQSHGYTPVAYTRYNTIFVKGLPME